VAYDYVIVGAGSAGCVLASRLGEDPDVEVAVVEAGPPDTDPEIHMPYAFGALLKSRVDWDLVTEPEPGLDGRHTYLPRGKVLGGSSSLNAMIYVRGNRADYDEWAALGLEGWGYDHVLPYFKRAEDNERGESTYHGVGGPLTVSDGRSMQPLVDAAIEAGVQAGIERNDDHNGATQDGVGRFQLTQRGGRRCSTALAYLHPAIDRGNVHVVTDALATRILFEGDRAAGVEILRGNELEELRAEREVIVSCGAYNSPQLLLLSGIGPPAELEPLGIAPKQDLPVGHNLQDHPLLSLVWLTDEESLLTAMTPGNLELFEREGRGPLTSNVGEGGAFVRTRPELEAPDIQIIFGALMLHEEFLGPLIDHAWGLGPILLKPESRGRVTLRSPVPHAKPRILHNYLTTEADRQTMIEGVRMAMDLASRPALRRIRRADFVAPATDSDADILELLRRRAHTVFHPVGTCAMGTVVDAELKVYGVEGLRVVDASVMPTVPRGNTNAPTIMIAEKASDLIRGLPPLARAADHQHVAGSAPA
jgi:choline dehydrogenase-like flavoprotein